ncbi:hypothetical protein FJD32_004245 [Shewanella sp. LC6]|uniref:hypothetical protein n=1 Tax=unclassified Shewanella TaxID=196818 RepID=UPI000DB19AB8|nr:MULTISPECIES: hypothetical protein [unclassified Shewanella]PZP30316.1 MAG: hypothetical protein DI594_15755 [Shewanella oneidensis]QQK58791.1 hypothetical protein FJD32_004245 [Shewanella sp. LC6]TPE50644.1 hypothetical protein FJD33_20085 [Shewanella sp. LC2]
MLPEDKMPEAEVTLRLAISLIENGHVQGDIIVAIDGAQVRTKNTIHFQLVEFLNERGWTSPVQQKRWQSKYSNKKYAASIIVRSSSGVGDLVAELRTGQRLRVESKKGPLIRSKSSQEYSLIREAIGQLVTIEHLEQTDVLAVAVPKSEKFDALAELWRVRPLMKSTGIHILTIGRDNSVSGLSDLIQ